MVGSGNVIGSALVCQHLLRIPMQTRRDNGREDVHSFSDSGGLGWAFGAFEDLGAIVVVA